MFLGGNFVKKVFIFIISLLLILSVAGCKHEHAMQEKTILEVSCDLDGEVEHYCTECDYKYSEQIKSQGHNYGNESIILEATCTEDGKKEKVCSTCGKKSEEIIEAKHTLNEELITEATCRSAGKKKVNCSVCNFQEIQEIQAKGHTFVDKTCLDCKAYNASELDANTWYVYNQLNILQVQNAVVSTAYTMGKGVVTGYYPVCEHCHITGLFSTAGPEINYPVTKTYHCADCDKDTYVKFKIEY